MAILIDIQSKSNPVQFLIDSKIFDIEDIVRMGDNGVSVICSVHPSVSVYKENEIDEMVVDERSQEELIKET